MLRRFKQIVGWNSERFRHRGFQTTSFGGTALRSALRAAWRPPLVAALLFALFLQPHAFAQSKPHERGAATAPATVRSCGIEFEIPSAYKITKPKRSGNSCSFDIVSRKPQPFEGDCWSKEEGGTPPYDVCDWHVVVASTQETVNVVATNISERGSDIPGFEFKDGAWRSRSAYGNGQPSEVIDFFGRTAYTAESDVSGRFERKHHKKSQGRHAGTYSSTLTMFQLAPKITVVLTNPPVDDVSATQSQCTIFCESIRVDTNKKQSK